MSTNNFFDLKRTLLLIKRIYFVNKNMILGSLLAYSGIMLLLLILYKTTFSTVGMSFKPLMLTSCNLMFFWGLLYFMGKIVSEMHKPSKAFFYLTLPASNFEKFLSLWFTCSLLFTFIIITLNYLVLLLGFALKSFIDEQVIMLNMSIYLKQAFYFIFIQTIFFAGTVYFRKNQFLKVVSILLILCIIYILVIIYFNLEIGRLDEPSFIYYITPAPTRWRLYDVAFFYITPLLLLISSYFRIKEKEV